MNVYEYIDDIHDAVIDWDNPFDVKSYNFNLHFVGDYDTLKTVNLNGKVYVVDEGGLLWPV